VGHFWKPIDTGARVLGQMRIVQEGFYKEDRLDIAA
jgi:hypothetical protein